MTADIPVIASSGNVFADLNIKNPEEALAKAKLVQQIGAIIRQKKLSQTAAAEICGVDQPKISKLLKGELYGFSTDQLLRFLTAFGQDVEIVVKTPARKRQSKGKLTVRAA